MQKPPIKKKNDNDDHDDASNPKPETRNLTRYSGWFHPHKSWKMIFIEYIISWFLRLDKAALACQQIMAAQDKDEEEEEETSEEAAAAAAVTVTKDKTSTTKNNKATTTTKTTTSASSITKTNTRRIFTKKSLQLMTLENIKVRNRMQQANGLTMLDMSLKQWSRIAKCPIIDYDLYIPVCPNLLHDWGIINNIELLNESHLLQTKQQQQQKEDILVKVRFPACLLPIDNDENQVDDADNDNKINMNNTINHHHVLRPTSIDLKQILQQHSHVPIVLHFHGGGLTLGSAKYDTVGIDLIHGVCNQVMKKTIHDNGIVDDKNNVAAAMILFDIDYSLAPEHAFPIAIVQGLTVLQYILHDLNCQDHKIHITGVSAGGLLAAVTTIQGMRHFPGSIASSILLCPFLDPSCQSSSFIRNETSSWLVPTAWLQWCWQVYLYNQTTAHSCSTPTDTNHANNNNHVTKESTTDTTTTATTTTTTVDDTTLQPLAWWQECKNNNSNLAPLMSPLWDDFHDLFHQNKKNTKTTTTNNNNKDESLLTSSSSSWPRFLITTNRGDPLHDDGVALVQKLRAAAVSSSSTAAAVSLVDGDNNNNNDKNNNDDAAAAVMVQHLDHDGTHWLGTFLDSTNNQELIHACKDIFFPSTSGK